VIVPPTDRDHRVAVGPSVRHNLLGRRPSTPVRSASCARHSTAPRRCGARETLRPVERHPSAAITCPGDTTVGCYYGSRLQATTFDQGELPPVDEVDRFVDRARRKLRYPHNCRGEPQNVRSQRMAAARARLGHHACVSESPPSILGTERLSRQSSCAFLGDLDAPGTSSTPSPRWVV